MKESEWEEFYRPIKNHLAPNSSRRGDMFETFGKELKFVHQQHCDKVWTWIEGSDDNKTYIVSGYHHVNRLGYFICKKAWSENTVLEICIE